MATNPMQRKARNSFLLGMLITLTVCAVIGVALYFMMAQKDKKKEQEEGALTYVYKLKTSVKSGETIDASKVEEVIVTEKAVPKDAYEARAKKEDKKGNVTWTPKAFAASGYKSKLDLGAGTIITKNMLYEGEEITSDLRYVEYNMLTLPTTLTEGDYIDIRLTFSNGLDLIVVSKREVKSILGNTIGLELTEGDITMMESAIVEAYIMKGSKLYAIQYVEPGNQEEAKKTYTPTTAVQELIKANTNIVAEARNSLVQRFDAGMRTWIDAEKSAVDGSERKTNLETSLQKEIEDAQKAREAYLSGLTSY